MQLNSTEISELIKKRIAQFDVVSEARNTGTIVSVSDGIIRIHGLSDVMPVSYTHLDVYKRQD